MIRDLPLVSATVIFNGNQYVGATLKLSDSGTYTFRRAKYNGKVIRIYAMTGASSGIASTAYDITQAGDTTSAITVTSTKPIWIQVGISTPITDIDEARQILEDAGFDFEFAPSGVYCAGFGFGTYTMKQIKHIIKETQDYWKPLFYENRLRKMRWTIGYYQNGLPYAYINNFYSAAKANNAYKFLRQNYGIVAARVTPK